MRSALFSTLQVRNEIAVLKKVSSGHRNIVTLHDYFEVCSYQRLSSVDIHRVSDFQDRTQLVSLFRSLHRWRTVRSYMCQGAILRGVSPPVATPKAQRHSIVFCFCRDAADLVRTVFKAVEYIHHEGIVHRDLKPENLLFRTKAEDADIMIADFGLSRVMDDNKHILLTEICGTPGVSS